ncbi:MAG: hypothetical protein AAF587_33040 [Bacteroidota bacterium]
MSGELTHLVFRAFESEEELSQQGNARAEFQAMFNPETFSIGNTFEFDDSQADGETGSEQKFKRIAPREFTFELLVDGTGASGVKKDVEEEIQQFKKLTQLVGNDERRPPYLTVTWGTINLRAVLKKFDIKYTLFSNNGKPVRVVLMLILAEYLTPAQQMSANPASSQSITSLTIPEAGSSLEMVARQKYGGSEQLIALAKENGLDSLKQGIEGQRLELPSKDSLTSLAQNEAQGLANQASNQATNTVQQNLSNLF